MTIPRWVKVYAKAIAVFVGGVVINMVVDLAQGSKPWPQNGNEWLQYVLTSFGLGLVALVTRNKIIQKQLDADPNVVGGVVIDDPVNKGLVKHKADEGLLGVRDNPPLQNPNPKDNVHKTPWDE